MMNKRTERQYRYIKPEIRAENSDDGKKVIRGYFSVFNEKYEMFPEFSESIDPHAFDNTLGDDVRALWNHNADIVLGRTKARTLNLSVDSHGLFSEIDINEKDSDAVNAHARVERGDVSECSFGFDIVREEFSERPDGGWHSTILEVKLYEVSPCTFPAYKQTSISARAEDFSQLKNRQVDAWKARTLERIRKNAETNHPSV